MSHQKSVRISLVRDSPSWSVRGKEHALQKDTSGTRQVGMALHPASS